MKNLKRFGISHGGFNLRGLRKTTITFNQNYLVARLRFEPHTFRIKVWSIIGGPNDGDKAHFQNVFKSALTLLIAWEGFVAEGSMFLSCLWLHSEWQYFCRFSGYAHTRPSILSNAAVPILSLSHVHICPCLTAVFYHWLNWPLNVSFIQILFSES